VAGETLVIGGVEVSRGETRRIQLPVAKLYTDTELSVPVHIVRGKRAGPTLFVSAAIHGDELNGIEIVHRVIRRLSRMSLRGTLIAVPMVNVYGVIDHSRYLPDRRDLNRSFPGSPRGSLAGRLAHLFLEEVVSKCQYGIDLHTGALHRSNLPQIRGDLDQPETAELAHRFGVPVLLNSTLRDGSLREAAHNIGVKVLLYEAGEALRYDELCIRVGVRGVLNVMRHLGMLRASRARPPGAPFVATSSSWVRAPDSGIVSHVRQLGERVEKGDLLAEICGPYGDIKAEVRTHTSGIIIGKQNIPLVQEGEAIYHIAYFGQPGDVADSVEQMHSDLGPVMEFGR